LENWINEYVLFPLAAICEMIADPTSHNMFPFEFIGYTAYNPALAGSYTSQLIKSFSGCNKVF
jgi:hypothetical protein